MSIHVRTISPFCTRSGIEERIPSILAILCKGISNSILKENFDFFLFGWQKIEDVRISLEFISILETMRRQTWKDEMLDQRINVQLL